MTSEILELGGTPMAAAAPAIGASERAPRWVVPVVAGLCVVALTLRVAIGMHSGMWRDEAEFLDIVGSPSWAAMLDFLRQHESHPPLFYAVMRVWLWTAGDNDAAALAIPIALGGALVPAVYAVGARLLSWRVGLFAAVATAFSPTLVAGGAMARPYSLLPLLTLASTYALVRAVDLGGRRRWAAYAAGTLALVYTHNWGWLVLAAQWVALAVCLRRGVPRPRAAVVREWAGAQGVVAVGFLPWLPSFMHQASHAGYGSNPLLTGGDAGDLVTRSVGLTALVVTSTMTLPDGSELAISAVLWTLTVSLLAVGVGWRRDPGRPRRPRFVRTAPTVIALTPLAAIGLALALSRRSNLLVPHCIAVLTPLLLLVVAAALDRWRAAGLAWLAGSAAFALTAGYAVMLPLLYQEHRSNAREVARQVTAEAAPTDLLVVAPWWLASSFNRYYSPPTEQIDFPTLSRLGAVPYDDGPRRIGDSGALARAQMHLDAGRLAGRRVWFVTEGAPNQCPDAACTAQVLGSGDFSQIGQLRAGDLRAYIIRLYGPPVRCLTGTVGTGRLESLRACLFVAS